MRSSRPMRCEECRRETRDARWVPFCPACYEWLRQAQRREQVRLPAVESAGWPHPESLDDRFREALGSELPLTSRSRSAA